MRYLILLLPLLLSANNFNYIKKEEEKKSYTLLNEIKEKNGLILSKEDILENYLREQILSVLSFYKKSKFIQTDDLKKFVNNATFKELLKNDKEFIYNNEKVSLNDIAYHVALVSKNGLFEYFLENEGYKDIPKSFSFNSMDEETIKYKLKTLYEKANKIEKGSILLNLAILEKYKLLDLLNNYSYKDKDFELSNEDYLYLVANEEKFIKSNIYKLLKEKLYKNIEKNEIVEFSEYFIEDKPSYFIKNYNMYGFNKHEVTIQAPFVTFLLKAKGKVKYSKDYAKAIEEAYGMKEFEVVKVKDFVITYINKKFYKEYDLNSFKKLEAKGK